MSNDVSLKIKDITPLNLDEIPSPCISCLYWKDTSLIEKVTEDSARKVLKKEWLQDLLQKYGFVGKILYLEAKPIGCAFYGPFKAFPSIKSYGSIKASPKEAFLACLYITSEEYRGRGFGRALLKSVLEDLRKREFNAVYTFARRSSSNNPSGPLSLYLTEGFYVVDESIEDFPLVRKDL